MKVDKIFLRNRSRRDQVAKIVYYIRCNRGFRGICGKRKFMQLESGQKLFCHMFVTWLMMKKNSKTLKKFVCILISEKKYSPYEVSVLIFTILLHNSKIIICQGYTGRPQIHKDLRECLFKILRNAIVPKYSAMMLSVK